MSKRFLGICILWFVTSLGGCSPAAIVDEEQNVGEDQSIGETTAAVTFNTCGFCPSGYYATRYYCDGGCGSCTTNKTNAATCASPPTCGSFSICAVGGSLGCPPGFSITRYFCNGECGDCLYFGNTATECRNIENPTCCYTCSPPPKGSANDRGATGGLHYVELYYNFSSSNPSIGTLTVAQCSCAKSFTVGQIVCNGVPVSASIVYSSTTQVNIALPASSVARNCVAYSSSQNTQFVEFNFTTQPAL